MTWVVAALPPRQALALQRLSCEMPKPDDRAGFANFTEFVELAKELGARTFYREDS